MFVENEDIRTEVILRTISYIYRSYRKNLLSVVLLMKAGLEHADQVVMRGNLSSELICVRITRRSDKEMPKIMREETISVTHP